MQKELKELVVGDDVLVTESQDEKKVRFINLGRFLAIFDQFSNPHKTAHFFDSFLCTFLAKSASKNMHKNGKRL